MVCTKSHQAFTLAEVLITLGIIGVVAAITMPVVISKINDTVLENQVKKVKTTLVNGYKLMMTKEEVFKVQDIPFLQKCNNLQDTNCVASAHNDFFKIVSTSTDAMPNEYIIKDTSSTSPFNWSNVKYSFITPDGAVIGLLYENSDTISIVADVNGKKRPNTTCKDLLKFKLTGTGVLSEACEELATQNNKNVVIEEVVLDTPNHHGDSPGAGGGTAAK
jgi:prepilin-type N-terminal cleavage/methylation domain-containing protein